MSFTGFDALELVGEDIPQPEAGQVLVRVRASSLNFRDPVIGNGEFPFQASPGFGRSSAPEAQTPRGTNHS
jgi:NADPH:quinone reductase-like Zn-dependent oxidoreductase